MKKFEFQKNALCRVGLARPGGSDVESRGQSANCNAETVLMRAKSERQIQSRLCVVAAVQTSSALPLLLSLLLLGSSSRGKGDQCRKLGYIVCWRCVTPLTNIHRMQETLIYKEVSVHPLMTACKQYIRMSVPIH